MRGKDFTALDWDDLRHFEALAQTGTLMGAARWLGVEHATVSRRVAALENVLGRKLIDRRGRRLRLTADGERVADHVRLMAVQAAAIGQFGRTGSQAMTGHVRISAPPALSSVVLARALVRLQHDHPGIHVTLVGERRHASLENREADIAIRLSRPETGDYVVTRLGTITFALYATTTYLATVLPEDWTFIGYDDAMNGAPQQVLLRDIAAGRPIALTSSVLEVQAAVARLDGGVVMLPDFAVPADDALEKVPGQASLQRDVWRVVHADIRDVPVIREVAAALASAFAA